MILTPATLARAMQIPLSRASIWAPVMTPALKLARINSAQRLACFVAQVGHETMGIRYVKEIWGPTPAQRRYEPGTTLAKRLGNFRPGDGKRFLGRGLIQTTGRANYLHVTLRLRELLGNSTPDFVATPALLELPEWAAMSAGLYWLDRRLNAYADMHDFIRLTRRINGGINGLADRQSRYVLALPVFNELEFS